MAGSTANAALLFEESFDYGASDISNFDDSQANYTGNTGVIDYVASASLPGLGGGTGGHLYYDFATPNNRNVTRTGLGLDPFPTAGAGDTFWIAGIIEYNTVGEIQVSFNSGQSVNTFGFGFNSSGEAGIWVSDNGNASAFVGVGISPSVGSSYTFVSRATLGSGTSPNDSVVDFWFNPSEADLVSTATLGTPDFTTGADSKIGRDSGAYTDLVFNVGDSPFARVDEIRFGTELADINGAVIPEPSSIVLVGLAVLLFAAMILIFLF